jgi:hypothetical protein
MEAQQTLRHNNKKSFYVSNKCSFGFNPRWLTFALNQLILAPFDVSYDHPQQHNNNGSHFDL